jgi:hypothetical protein
LWDIAVLWCGFYYVVAYCSCKHATTAILQPRHMGWSAIWNVARWTLDSPTIYKKIIIQTWNWIIYLGHFLWTEILLAY